MAITYDKIATTTLSGTASSVTFSSIAASWTDLKLIIVTIVPANNGYYYVQFNGDTAANYSCNFMQGNGTSATSTKFTTANGSDAGRVGGSAVTTAPSLLTLDIFSYRNSTHKTYIGNHSSDQNGAGVTYNVVGKWGSTAAITSFSVFGNGGSNSFTTGTSATLYGILKA